MANNVPPAAVLQDSPVVSILFLYRLKAGKCLPPETARIAWLPARYVPLVQLFEYYFFPYLKQMIFKILFR